MPLTTFPVQPLGTDPAGPSPGVDPDASLPQPSAISGGDPDGSHGRGRPRRPPTPRPFPTKSTFPGATRLGVVAGPWSASTPTHQSTSPRGGPDGSSSRPSPLQPSPGPDPEASPRQVVARGGEPGSHARHGPRPRRRPRPWPPRVLRPSPFPRDRPGRIARGKKIKAIPLHSPAVSDGASTDLQSNSPSSPRPRS